MPGSPCTLSVYEPDLALRSSIPLSVASDAHSMLAYRGGNLVVSTGTNQIIRVTFDEESATAWEQPFWSLGEDRCDRDHLNGIAEWQDRIVISMLGPVESDDGMTTRKAGRVLDIETQETISANLHPHTVKSFDGVLYWVESRLGLVWRRSIDGTAEALFRLEGYLRGLAADGNRLYIAASAQRLRSRSTGALTDPPHGDLGPRRCLLYRVDLDDRIIECRDLTPFGREIYDLQILPADCPRPVRGKREESIVRRQLAYDIEHQRTLEDLRRALQQYEALLPAR